MTHDIERTLIAQLAIRVVRRVKDGVRVYFK